MKFDGYRIACIIEEGRVRLESRRNNDWTAKFAEIVAAAKQLPVQSALFDGEVAIVAASGVTSFQSLQNAFSGAPRQGLTYFAFDLLHLDGRDAGTVFKRAAYAQETQLALSCPNTAKVAHCTSRW